MQRKSVEIDYNNYSATGLLYKEVLALGVPLSRSPSSYKLLSSKSTPPLLLKYTKFDSLR